MTTSYPLPEQAPPHCFPLIKKFYREHYPSGKPNKADLIWVIRLKGKIICAVRLKQFSSYQFLTAMTTATEHRSQGLGQHFLRNLSQPLAEKNCYCFALTHLTAFYAKHNFQIVSVEHLPEDLKQRYLSYTQQGRKLTPMQYRVSYNQNGTKKQ